MPLLYITKYILSTLLAPGMLLKLIWILIMFEGKYHQENAKNGISERLEFEIFWWSMPPDP